MSENRPESITLDVAEQVFGRRLTDRLRDELDQAGVQEEEVDALTFGGIVGGAALLSRRQQAREMGNRHARHETRDEGGQAPLVDVTRTGDVSAEIVVDDVNVGAEPADHRVLLEVSARLYEVALPFDPVTVDIDARQTVTVITARGIAGEIEAGDDGE